VSHLADDELVRWRDHGDPKDRDRVLGHLATCEDCRQRLADLVREAPAASAQTSFDPAPFVQRGTAVFAPRRRWSASSLWLGIGGLAVATASLFLVMRPSAPTITPVEIRGSELQGLAPIGDVRAVNEFRWASPFAAPRYRLVVRDGSGAVFMQTDVTGESWSAPPESQSKFVAGSYQWTVDALDATGAVIASSKPQTFTIPR